ncbi:thioesterase family protein [Rhodococcus sp. Z13]|uniref:Thioesterase family protein n=1 Tax=Rhodococcus sacchari TaxID=2962047 RepID=A0ACD4DFY7_9NOCA|nr:thioesterase family protein [Rhodococcus sp. Z13]UYP18901.1 thioesterase family protein [Rhodococcus sp. Z13]
MSYFERLGPASFRATSHVSGAWNETEQHIAPALGLLAHVIETDRDERRDDGLAVARLSYDILGTVPIGRVDTRVEVLRPGRTIELVEATLVHDDRAIVRARAWLMQTRPTDGVAATALTPIPRPQELEPWDPTALWPGGYIDSVEVRRASLGEGRSSYWVRTDVALVEGDKVSDLARFAGLFDIANGMAVLADPRRVAFPNVDLTAHLFAEPRGEWLGFDTSVSFGENGIGLTTSVLHDEAGPIGTSSQILTVRPS